MKEEAKRVLPRYKRPVLCPQPLTASLRLMNANSDVIVEHRWECVPVHWSFGQISATHVIQHPRANQPASRATWTSISTVVYTVNMWRIRWRNDDVTVRWRNPRLSDDVTRRELRLYYVTVCRRRPAKPVHAEQETAICLWLTWLRFITS